MKTRVLCYCPLQPYSSIPDCVCFDALQYLTQQLYGTESRCRTGCRSDESETSKDKFGLRSPRGNARSQSPGPRSYGGCCLVCETGRRVLQRQEPPPSRRWVDRVEFIHLDEYGAGTSLICIQITPNGATTTTTGCECRADVRHWYIGLVFARDFSLSPLDSLHSIEGCLASPISDQHARIATPFQTRTTLRLGTAQMLRLTQMRMSRATNRTMKTT